tara:strand:- start:5587 stop:6096 length:510 start_codon:yes stop_codon:yes gene_type:complete
MKKAEAEAISKKYSRAIKCALGLNDWNITVNFRKCGLDEDRSSGTEFDGQCAADERYKFATITINHKSHATVEDLLDTIIHEHIHILHAVFGLFRSAVSHAGPTHNDPHWLACIDVWMYCSEQFVARIEDMIKFGMGFRTSQEFADSALARYESTWGLGHGGRTLERVD